MQRYCGDLIAVQPINDATAAAAAAAAQLTQDARSTHANVHLILIPNALLSLLPLSGSSSSSSSGKWT
jgi:hypothetical protein